MYFIVNTSRVDAPITDHLRDFAPNLEKYKVVQNFPFRKIEIKRTAKFWVNLILKLKVPWIF